MKKISILFISLIASSVFAQQSSVNPQQSMPRNVTIGIGLIKDSVSNLSLQYGIFDFLSHNQLTDKNGTKILPILTMKRGVTDYYINGKMTNKEFACNVWYTGKLIGKINIYPNKYTTVKETNTQTQNNINSEGLKNSKDVYYESVNKKRSEELAYRSAHVNFGDENTISEKELQNQLFNQLELLILGNNSNYNPKRNFSFYTQLFPIKSYSAQSSDIADNIFGVQEPLDNYKITKEKNSLDIAESVLPNFTSDKLNIFFFTSSYISSGMQDQANKFVFPLYRHSTPARLYYMCGKAAYYKKHYESAIECFYSGLFSILFATELSTNKEIIKRNLLKNLDSAYTKNNQLASAYLCKGLAELHNSLSASKIFAQDDNTVSQNFYKIGEMLTEVERKAKAARRDSRMATFQAVTAGLAAATSAVNDGLNGLSGQSLQTQSLANQMATFIGQSSDISMASYDATNAAANTFANAFSDVVADFKNNNIETDKPILAYDFLTIIVNKQVAIEQKVAILNFTDNIPALKEKVRNYYTLLNNGSNISANVINDIYRTLSKIEQSAYIAENFGKASDVNVIMNYK